MKTVFMGTPDFAVNVLDAMVQAGHEVGYVITQPDKARDRGKKIQFTPVKEKALEYGLTVLQPERVKGNEELLAQLTEYNPDIIVVVAYGQILPKSILDLPRLMPLCLDCQPQWLVMDHDLAYERDSFEDLRLSLEYTRSLLAMQAHM